MSARSVKGNEVNSVVVTLSEAFSDDPVWVWILPDPAKRRKRFAQLWQVFVESAAADGWVWSTERAEAVAVWNPPGVGELAGPAPDRLEEVIMGFGDDGRRVRLTLEAFADHRPAEPHHFYLNMLGVRSGCRGRGLGMSLLSENLSAVDSHNAPAYLESSNPANVDRYRALAFEVVEDFHLPEGGPQVTTMWREPRGK